MSRRDNDVSSLRDKGGNLWEVVIEGAGIFDLRAGWEDEKARRCGPRPATIRPEVRAPTTSPHESYPIHRDYTDEAHSSTCWINGTKGIGCWLARLNTCSIRQFFDQNNFHKSNNNNNKKRPVSAIRPIMSAYSFSTVTAYVVRRCQKKWRNPPLHSRSRGGLVRRKTQKCPSRVTSHVWFRFISMRLLGKWGKFCRWPTVRSSLLNCFAILVA